MLAGALAGPAAAASASPPTRAPQPVPDFRLPHACRFPVLLHATVNRSTATTFSDGHVHITGALRVRMTDLRNGHSLTVNSSGPATVWYRPGGVVVDGRGVGFIALSTPFGRPGFLLETRGQVVADARGLRVVHGATRNICPMIA